MLHGWSFQQAITLVTMLFGAGVALRILSFVRRIFAVVNGIGSPDPPTGIFKRVSDLEMTAEMHEDAFVHLGFERRHGERRHITPDTFLAPPHRVKGLGETSD